MYSDPVVEDGKENHSFSKNVFLLDIGWYDDLIKLCKNNKIEILEWFNLTFIR